MECDYRWGAYQAAGAVRARAAAPPPSRDVTARRRARRARLRTESRPRPLQTAGEPRACRALAGQRLTASPSRSPLSPSSLISPHSHSSPISPQSHSSPLQPALTHVPLWARSDNLCSTILGAKVSVRSARRTRLVPIPHCAPFSDLILIVAYFLLYML